MTGESTEQAVAEQAPAASQGGPPRTVTSLQCELRSLFLGRPVHRALTMALRRIGETLNGEYAVVHARWGVQPISEEWCRGETMQDVSLRESVNSAMLEAMCEGSSRWFRLREHGGVLLVASLYDQDVQPAGGLAVLLPSCSPDRASRLLAVFESLAGFVALLMDPGRQQGGEKGRTSGVDGDAASHPVRLAMTMAGELKNRFGFDLAAVGYVHRRRVQVEAVCGLDELRASNPGVRLIRAAMEECLDRDAPVAYAGRQGAVVHELEDDCRLHAQWSRALGGNAVGTAPVVVGDETVAVLAVSHANPAELTRERLLRAVEATTELAAMVPLAQAASRGLIRHGIDALGRGAGRLMGEGRRKSALIALLAVALCAFIAFGRMQYNITVPCVVQPAALRTVACPRDGVLADLFVRPGDPVQAGQLLAVLDAHEDVLRQAELTAEVASLETLADEALAQRDPGQLRVHRARITSLRAQLAAVENGIALAQIRSTQPGIVMEGDLRELVGSRMSMGDPLFEIARYDRMKVVLKVPESLVLDARGTKSAVFAPAAQPDRVFELSDLDVAPSGTVVDGRNVFLAEALAEATLEGLAPGMEGVAQLDVGSRSVAWVLTHRLVDWLRLNFWV